ncbi:hypothetical protein QBC35DRAFT_69680 [Podospora australis]|uniref:Uncharacterized protein n=1 Tax=Podospora australis TaxID=1536484 RepID=A0AAN7AKF8_9PEZI|nr:hypothetical protein QBC35DRAFT_69680 [Podospora australis]
MAGTSITVPQISQADMIAFHETHFPAFAVDHFHSHFLRPDQTTTQSPTSQSIAHEAEDDDYEEEEDDGLGYYPDGVKRTLTDDQIAIFRHSELEALRRAGDSSKIKKATTKPATEDTAQELSEGEISSVTPPSTATAKKNKKRKRGKNKHAGGEPPIDLRKRTWDVVDTGLATLDYGEEDTPQPSHSNAVQRRQISYDD